MWDLVLEKSVTERVQFRCRDFFFIIAEQNRGKAFVKTLGQKLATKCGVFTLPSVYSSVV